MSNDELATELHCPHCNRETVHTLVYAGRLLVSTTCQECHTQVKHQPGDLRLAYLKDLEHRISTKPARLWRGFWRSPFSSMWSFPRKFMRQPRKFLNELKKLFK